MLRISIISFLNAQDLYIVASPLYTSCTNSLKQQAGQICHLDQTDAHEQSLG